MAILLALTLVAVFLYLIYGTTNPLTKEAANQKCTNFLEEVQNDIHGAPQYTVVGSAQNCSPEENELGEMGYIANAEVAVTYPNIHSKDESSQAMQHLADAMPKRKYAVFVDNVTTSDGRQLGMCVSASGYFVSNGDLFPQGSSDHKARYTDPGSIKGFAPCQNLLQKFPG